ncbi:MAG: protein phosphatase 2C domain-containing protein [Armatimonadetes bacterium]|nr:protein phosphatase 2C domain-containing protein [Armatimonadota bacterium]MDE2205312.1 protein phosphatase 2C domain-containing protein [Armatimonadota bacterium]
MKLVIGSRSDVGRRRSRNEDAVVVLSSTELGGHVDALVVVADGIGGTGGGAQAARIVVDTISDRLKSSISSNARGAVGEALKACIIEANALVRSQQKSSPELASMGATCVAAAVVGDLLIVAHVGDSRAYLLRDRQLRQLTDDHSEVWQEVKAGAMTPEQARRSAFRNSITRAVGLDSTVNPDVVELTLLPDDTLLFCSDGLSSEVPDADLAGLLMAAPQPQLACDRLVERALRNGGRDNVTVVVTHCDHSASDIESEAPTVSPVAQSAGATPVERAPAFAAPSGAAEAEPEVRRVTTHFERRRRLTTTDAPQAVSARSVPHNRRESGQHRSQADLAESGDGESQEPMVLVTGVLVGLVFLLGLVIVALVLRPSLDANAIKLPTQASGAMRFTDLPLNYQDPVTLTGKAVRSSTLLVTPDGSAVVIAQNGARLLVGRDRSVAKVTGLHLPVVPGAGQSAGQDRDVYLVMDASGNAYCNDPINRVIDKFDPAGKLISSSIGKGKLTAPAAIGVNQYGDLFVIDNHHLKYIAAQPPHRKPSASDDLAAAVRAMNLRENPH